MKSHMRLPHSSGAKRVLILGANGMLGHILFRKLRERSEYEVLGTLRASDVPNALGIGASQRIFTGVNVHQFDSVARAIKEARPRIIINCIGAIKQRPEAAEPISAIAVNALFPHLLMRHCMENSVRLIHISTDCVFSGTRGMYTESDVPDASDLYGRSKLLGEPDCPLCFTMRTSIIGHELESKNGLLEWFLASEGAVRGFSQAIFSGFPTVELAGIIAQYILPMDHLDGLYHISSKPVSKLDLLRMIATEYGKDIQIVTDPAPHCDRSLDGSSFCRTTGYAPPNWRKLIKEMHEDFKRNGP